ncbi:MAG: dTDP-4-dehydrorhamnose 3,5-epimerase [Proteobacteria bacterium]|nr:MAG: dTDP-4-dehydrorhamnose 3,5-epimerase [Pseudomonadota bacterium]
MRFIEAPLKGLMIVEPAVFKDERGHFFESYNRQVFEQNGLNLDFVQDNQSFSKKHALRGLHFQSGEAAQAKLVRVIQGSVLDVVVDIRPDSHTFLKHFSIELTAMNFKQLLIPRGFAHGFLTLSETAVFSYKCDNLYSKAHDRGIRFDDPEIAINWPAPVSQFIISEKDKALPKISEIRKEL